MRLVQIQTVTILHDVVEKPQQADKPQDVDVILTYSLNGKNVCTCQKNTKKGMEACLK